MRLCVMAPSRSVSFLDVVHYVHCGRHVGNPAFLTYLAEEAFRIFNLETKLVGGKPVTLWLYVFFVG